MNKVVALLLAMIMLSSSMSNTSTASTASSWTPIGEAVVQALNQSASEGREFNKGLYDQLPTKYEEAADEYGLTAQEREAVAERLLGNLLARSYDFWKYSDNGIELHIESLVTDIRHVAAIERFQFPVDAPSAEARYAIAEKILGDKLPEAFQRDFKKAITVDELARLYFGEEPYLDHFTIDRDGFSDETPAYVKAAFVYGFIDDLSELSLTMTRVEAARRISKSLTYILGTDVFSEDFAALKPEDFHAVANVMSYGIIETIRGRFEPNKPFTREQAILGMERFSYNNIRGILPMKGISRKAEITVGTDYMFVDFESEEARKDYYHYHLSEIAKGVKLSTGKYQRIDVGFAILELWSQPYDVKYTFKSGVDNIRFRGDTIVYGKFVYTNWHGEGYVAEPRELKAGEKAVMDVQPDAVHKKLYAKVDQILKKIVKPGMTDEQKVKAMFDYVVGHVQYTSGTDYISGENALEAIEKGKGVCVHYASLFHYLATRAGIPDLVLQGHSFVGQHAWNMVYVNGKWLYLDATLADGKKKIDYMYYLKDAMTMMQTRVWQGYGYPDINIYPAVDGMKIATTRDLRAYIMLQMTTDNDMPDKITFAVTNKAVDTDMRFLKIRYPYVQYKLSYDAKKKVYTLTKTAML